MVLSTITRGRRFAFRDFSAATASQTCRMSVMISVGLAGVSSSTAPRFFAEAMARLDSGQLRPDSTGMPDTPHFERQS